MTSCARVCLREAGGAGLAVSHGSQRVKSKSCRARATCIWVGLDVFLAKHWPHSRAFRCHALWLLGPCYCGCEYVSFWLRVFAVRGLVCQVSFRSDAGVVFCLGVVVGWPCLVGFWGEYCVVCICHCTCVVASLFSCLVHLGIV